MKKLHAVIFLQNAKSMCRFDAHETQPIAHRKMGAATLHRATIQINRSDTSPGGQSSSSSSFHHHLFAQ